MAVSAELSERSTRLFRDLSNETEATAPIDPVEGFDPFNPQEVTSAGLLGLELALRAASELDDEDAISKVLDTAEAAARDHPAGLVRHALAIFATHTPRGRLVGKPRMMQMMPSAALPGLGRVGLEAATGPEAVLDYWRENALANEHHQHWHEVYPSSGVLRPVAEIPAEIVNKIETQGWNAVTEAELKQVFRAQDRHGELFVYMHQQMLARYDAERLSNGLDPVRPLDADGLDAPIPEGFDPGPSLSPPFVPRPVDRKLSAGWTVQLGQWLGEIRLAIAQGAFRNSDGSVTQITPAILGDQIEAVHNIHRGAVDKARYGNLHNSGHGALSALAGAGSGVMASTVTAIRDPVFYRWHKVIDNLAFDWQETRTPVDFSDAPPVSIAGEDQQWAAHGIVLLNSDSLPSDADAALELCEELLGGTAWDTPVSQGTLTSASGQGIEVTDTLATRMKFVDFPDPADPNATVPVAYLAHDPFTLALRLSNTGGVDQGVTARIFLCPAERSEDRRFWIELDKFPITLAAGEKRVVLRSDTLSSVVKKPAEPELHPDLLADADGDPRCDCGWPYSLLLPKGTEAGMPFRLMVVLTDAALDSIAAPGTCGSLSFCGARDALYPDRRDMGYPFDRPWSGAIADVTAATPCLAGRSLTIRHVPFGVV